MARRVGGHHFLGEVLLAAEAHGGGEAGATLAEPPRCPLSLSRVGSDSGSPTAGCVSCANQSISVLNL